MPMPHLHLYCRPSDLVRVTPILIIGVASGTVSADPNYGLASLHDGNPAKPCKFIDAPPVAIRITWDFGAPQRLDGIVLPSHNFDTSLEVRFQGNAANDWGAPTLNAAPPIAAKRLDGHSRSPWADLRTVAGYAEAGFRYWSLYLPVNSVAPQLGEVCLVKQWRQFERPFDWRDLARDVNRGYIPAKETSFGVETLYKKNVKRRGISTPIIASSADYQALLDLVDDGQGVDPFIFILDRTVTDDGGLMVRCSQSMVQQFRAGWKGGNAHAVTVEFIELSRGLPL
jgi:hypothetical protein